MNKHILSVQYCTLISLILLNFLALPRLALAGNLKIEPAMPIIGQGESISLRVLGAQGKEITWIGPNGNKGELQEQGNYRAIYTAPNEVGQYNVSVLDQASKKTANIQVTVLPKEAAKRAFSPEKSVWEIVTNRNNITAVLQKGETLWVGTHGGLEKRNATTGKLIKVITFHSQDLEDNFITALADDNKGGVWVGTFFYGLNHLDHNGEKDNNNNSEAEDYGHILNISDIISDGEGGLWIGAGLAWNEKSLKVLDQANPGIHKNIMHTDFKDREVLFKLVTKLFLKAFSEYEESDESPSDFLGSSTEELLGELPLSSELSEAGLLGGLGGNSFGGGLDNILTGGLFEDSGLLSDNGNAALSERDLFEGLGGNSLFGGGLGLFSDNGNGDLDALGLSSDALLGLGLDGGLGNDFLNGLLGTKGNVLAGSSLLPTDSLLELLTLFNNKNKTDLLSLLNCGENNTFRAALAKGTTNGLAHLKSEGTLDILNTDNSELPSNIVTDIVNDRNGGLWIGTYCGGLAHLNHQGQWRIYNSHNSGLPIDFINSLMLDEQNGLWVGTAFNGLAYLKHDQWQIFNTDSGLPHNNIISVPVSDGKGGIWVGTGNILDKNGGLVHLDKNQTVTLYNTTHLNLDNDIVSTTVSDGQNGLWLGTEQGLVHLNKEGHWSVWGHNNIELPDEIPTLLLDSFENVMIDDGQGGVWLGISLTFFARGLAHMSANHTFSFFSSHNSDLPDDEVFALARDAQGGLWVGTSKGLAHLSSEGEWQVFNTNNSGLPHNTVLALEHDEYNGGLWIGTKEKYLVHLTWDEKKKANKWKVYNMNDSGLPPRLSDLDVVNYEALLDDGKGGVWIGWIFWLIHLNHDGKWTLYHLGELGLPTVFISALESDGKGGLWISTGGPNVGKGGLAHFSRDGKWSIYTQKTHPHLPSDGVRDLLRDGSGGLWVGTNDGLFHKNRYGEWAEFKIDNSSLPNNRVRHLVSDGKNGLWVEALSLSHLTFSQKPLLCLGDDITKEQCANLLKGHRAAIIIHPNALSNVAHQDIPQDIGVDNMATHVYQTLFLRGYDHDEIYYLAYNPNLDFNGDNSPDDIVDAPMTLKAWDGKPLETLSLKHLEKAFEWAEKKHHEKTQDVPEEPLVVIFVDHGLPDKLVLNPWDKVLEESQFKALLDHYQIATGNQVVVILEACHSGTLIDALQAPDRLIITSTDDKLAYYQDLGRTSFSYFYFNQLHQGKPYRNSLQFVKDKLFAQIGKPFNQQYSQLNASPKSEMPANCLNDCFGQLPEPKLKPERGPLFLSTGESIELAVQIENNNEKNKNKIESVSVSVITPQEAGQYNEYGFKIGQPTLIDNLVEKEDGRWVTQFSDFTERGKYSFIFSAEYKIYSGRRRVSALPVTVYFQQCASYDINTNRLHIPALKMLDTGGEDNLYQADYAVINGEPVTFEMIDAMKQITGKIDSPCVATLKQGTLSIPAMDIPNEAGGMDVYRVELQRIPDNLQDQFTLSDFERLQ